jgi:L-lactate permease
MSSASVWRSAGFAASFLQGIAGLGAPVAAVVPLLIAIGVNGRCRAWKF